MVGWCGGRRRRKVERSGELKAWVSGRKAYTGVIEFIVSNVRDATKIPYVVTHVMCQTAGCLLYGCKTHETHLLLLQQSPLSFCSLLICVHVKQGPALPSKQKKPMDIRVHWLIIKPG